mmetsp:Transcript_78991/g.143987  ORF Transcript_78991/g.143987 Transcript_78991/m.143987 type:complete len:1094 (+) Transcript_78991:86-3367(+)
MLTDSRIEIRSMESSALQEPLSLRNHAHASEVDVAELGSLQRHRRAACVVQASDDARSNAVHTAKYSICTWLPKSLYMQFHRAANIYFVIVASLVCTPLWPGSPWPKVVTVGSILFVQALKDLYEDILRRRDDHEENLRSYSLYDMAQQRFISSAWRSCSVGDMILVKKGEQFPADALLAASSSGTTGICYVSTKSLDGETNLKQRQAPSTVPSLASGLKVAEEAEDACERILTAGIEIRLEQPHSSLLTMDCSVCLRGGQMTGASLENFALRGCVLENTDWVICIVCYVGDSTKARLNASNATLKRSELERYLNHCVSGIILCIFGLSFIFMVNDFVFHPDRQELSPKVFTVYLIALYAVLPMTLYIVFELLHIVIGWKIEADVRMHDANTACYAKVRNTSVLEDCGQASFIFSDKTGTLTANEMRFANGCMGTSVLGSCLPDATTGKPGPGFEEARRLLEAEPAAAAARRFFETLAVCHTVRVDEAGSYQGESPDEVALVQAASDAGVKLLARDTEDAGEVNVVQSTCGTSKYRVAHVLAFTSDRKRMSVICPTKDGGALVLTKGADAVMEGLVLDPLPEEARMALKQFARAGLRTLIVACRQMTAGEYTAWQISWDQANAAMMDRALEIDRVSAAAETGLSYVGITALEDRLQDHVPETISALRKAGIRVWVLTGDKVETAVEIAKSCTLFEDNMAITEAVGAGSAQEAIGFLRDALIAAPATADSAPANHGLVLDGMSVQHIMGDESARRALYHVAERSSACVCCRLSPLQKRELVELVRNACDSAITLAIGDGANDVPMIQGAHVGVGIRGKEGGSAVQASDVAISQFRFLANLLLCHGRQAYRRIATVVCYFMYKSVVLGWSYVLHAHASLFGGGLAFPELLDMLYNPLSSFAVFVLLAYDCDVPDEVALQRVQLYRRGLDRAYLNRLTFAKWMIIASVHGNLCWILPMTALTYKEDWAAQKTGGETKNFWAASLTTFTVIMLVIHGKLGIMAEKPMRAMGILAIVLELVAYCALAILLGLPLPLRSQELQGVPWTVLTSWPNMLCILLVPILALSVDVMVSCLERHCCATDPGHVRLADDLEQTTP